MRNTLLASTILMGLAPAANAFSSADDLPNSYQNSSFGSCTIQRYMYSASSAAYLYFGGGAGGAMPMGNYYASGRVQSYSRLTEQHIAACLGVPASAVSIIHENGADKTFATDNYIGVVFSLTQNGNGYAAGTHEISLTGSSSNPNTPATANAGADQTVASGVSVSLDGTGSNANDAGQTLTYRWVQTSGPSVALSSATAAQPTFTVASLNIGDADVVYGFNLVVNDGIADSTADTVQITAQAAANTPATANAGQDQTVTSGAGVTLNGTGSSANDAGQSLSYRWVQTSGPSVALSSATAAQPTFTAATLNIGDKDVVYGFDLVVNDGIADSAVDSVQVRLSAPSNTPASANAGQNQTVTSGAQVILDGGRSSANDSGQSLSYKWTQTSGPSVKLAGATTMQPSFTAPVLAVNSASAVLGFDLEVFDGQSTAKSSVVVTVSAQVDVTAPNAPSLSIVRNSDNSITAKGSAEAGSSVKVTFPDGTHSIVQVPHLTRSGNATTAAVGTQSATQEGAYSVTSGANQPDGNVIAIAIDQAGNVSKATSAATIAPRVEETTQAISDFQTGRRTQLLANQPGLRQIAFGGGGNHFTAEATRGIGQFDFGADLPMSGWVRLRGSWSEQGSREMTYAFGAVGTHRQITEDFIVGGMMQFDMAKETNATSTTEGQGWLIGPYVAIKHPDQPLYFDASLMYGQTENEVSPLGTYTDSFDSTRVVATGRISGDVTTQKATWTPHFGGSYVSDTSDAYTDGMGFSIPEVKQSSIQISGGLDVAYPIEIEMGEMELLGGISGHYDMTEASGLSTSSNSKLAFARVTVGFHYAPDAQTDIRANAFVDGLGRDGYKGRGIEIVFEKQF